MKIKLLLRFYFSAEKLERALDNLILHCACTSGGREGGDCGEYICRIIGEKDGLAALWGYLDGRMRDLAERDMRALREYAGMRCGIKSLGAEKCGEIKRAIVKFSRRTGNMEKFAEGVSLVQKYYCLLG